MKLFYKQVSLATKWEGIDLINFDLDKSLEELEGNI
jgi:hypothetical protein